MVGVLHQVAGLLEPAGAEVDRHHDLGADALGPVDELVQTELVGLHRVPGEVEPGRPIGPGADAVLPAVVGDEVAAGVADHGRADLVGEGRHVAAEAPLVGGRVAGLVDSGVDAATHVLDE